MNAFDDLINKYYVLWCDGKVDSLENKGYRQRLNCFSYCQWDYVPDVNSLMMRIDCPNIPNNVIIICSGGLSDEIIEQIETSRGRRQKVLGMQIFCFKIEKWAHQKQKQLVCAVVNNI